MYLQSVQVNDNRNNSSNIKYMSVITEEKIKTIAILLGVYKHHTYFYKHSISLLHTQINRMSWLLRYLHVTGEKLRGAEIKELAHTTLDILQMRIHLGNLTPKFKCIYA